MSTRILDVTDLATFERIPPCADPRFDHRTCDYWEDEARGSKAHRASWLAVGSLADASTRSNPSRLADNPFAPVREPAFNPFAPTASLGRGAQRGAGSAASRPRANPFGDDDEPELENPFAPKPPPRSSVGPDAPRKLQLVGRGLGVFGSYAKVLERGGEAVAYCQFGPLSAYPRAQRVRDLYPQLPSSPLPAVITCIATSAAGRREGLARTLVGAVTADLAGRGFSAVETYPDPAADPDETSAANPEFWLACGFALAVDDARFPVMRLEL